MKRLLACLTLALGLVLAFTSVAFADEGDIYINATNFPDPVFRARVTGSGGSAGGGWSADGKITQDELPKIKTLWLSQSGFDTTVITNLTGIEIFTSLETLFFRQNNMPVMPPLPNSIKKIDCKSSRITRFMKLPDSLEELDAYGNRLEELPHLPSKLKDLDVSSNQLTALPALPSLLSYLTCSNNNLGKLPSLPDSLTILRCEYCNLTVLPALPSNLFGLHCANNKLTALPKLNSGLFSLDCSKNKLSALDVTPASFMYSCTAYGQSVELTLANSAAGKWVKTIALNQPEFSDPALSYADGKLTGTSNALTSVDFALGTGNEKYTLSGTFTLSYLGSSDYIPVTVVTGVPGALTTGTALDLSTLLPNANASYRDIVWVITNATTTGASITDGILNTMAAGTLTITATIPDGAAPGVPFVKTFTINIDPVRDPETTLPPGTGGGDVIIPPPGNGGGGGGGVVTPPPGGDITKPADTKPADDNTQPSISLPTLTKPASGKVAIGKKSLKLSWKKAAAAQKVTGYQIQYKLKSAKKWSSKTVAANKGSLTIKGLKSGKVYQLRLRSVRKAATGATYSPWSKTITSKKVK